MTAWVTLLGAVVFGGFAYSVTPETSEAVILRWKAQKLRKETGNEYIRARGEGEKPAMTMFIQKYLTKPTAMLVREPIVSLLTGIYEQY